MGKGNPYHVPSGPHGGEFTHGPDSAAAKDTKKKHYSAKQQNDIKYASIDAAARKSGSINKPLDDSWGFIRAHNRGSRIIPHSDETRGGSYYPGSRIRRHVD